MVHTYSGRALFLRAGRTWTDTRFGFLLSLKTFQRLGYFVTSHQIPDAIIGHLEKTEQEPVDRQALAQYDVSRS